jgi:hypothetical protein
MPPAGSFVTSVVHPRSRDGADLSIAVCSPLVQTLRREHWPGYSVDLGEGFRLRKDRNGHLLEAVCWLRPHELGWELVLNVNGSDTRRVRF